MSWSCPLRKQAPFVMLMEHLFVLFRVYSKTLLVIQNIERQMVGW
jgi:hypothetical protein